MRTAATTRYKAASGRERLAILLRFRQRACAAVVQDAHGRVRVCACVCLCVCVLACSFTRRSDGRVQLMGREGAVWDVKLDMRVAGGCRIGWEVQLVVCWVLWQGYFCWAVQLNMCWVHWQGCCISL